MLERPHSGVSLAQQLVAEMRGEGGSLRGLPGDKERSGENGPQTSLRSQEGDTEAPHKAAADAGAQNDDEIEAQEMEVRLVLLQFFTAFLAM